jgi:hypothetical protein
MNYRPIVQHFGVDHKSVINWVKAYSTHLLDASVPEDMNNVEMYELFTFVGSKNYDLRDDASGKSHRLYSGLVV